MDSISLRTFLRRYRQLLTVVAFLGVLLAVFEFSGLRQHVSLGFLQQQLLAHRVTGLLVFILLFSLGNLIQIPGWLFLAAAVLTLGRTGGGLATYVAANASCAVTFLLIRFLGGDALRRLDSRLARKILARLDAHPVRSVALLRLVFQTLPAVNYALAMSGVRLRAHVIGTAAGLPLPIMLYCIFFDFLAQALHIPV